MDVNDLNLFVRIAQLRSISSAARDLGLTPAGASARLATLERKLGARLLHRTTRQATLTEDGLAFLPHAENVVLAAESARAALGREQAAPRGTLRIAAPSSFARLHIVPGLPDFMRRYPDLRLDMRISDSFVDLVDGAFDVAVRYADLGDSSFVARRIAPDRRVLVASPDYLDRCGHPQTLDNLDAHACLIVGTLDLWTFRGLNGEEIVKRITPALRINDGEAVREAARAGLGIALMATWCAADELRAGTLVPVLPAHPLVSTQTLWALYPSSRELAPKVRVFMDWLVARFGPVPYWDEGCRFKPGRRGKRIPTALSNQRGSAEGRVVARAMRPSRAKPPSPFRCFNSSPEVIRLVVMMYVRFPLSLRNVEDLLAERGIDICHETVRHWWNRFGPMFAGEVQRQRVSAMRGFRHWRWHLTVRFSDFTGLPNISDASEDANPRGLAFKVHMGTEKDYDVVAHSFNGFPVSTADEFGEFMRAVGVSKHNTDHPDAVERFLTLTQQLRRL